MTSPWLTASEAATYLRFVDAEGRPNTKALRKYLDRHPIPVSRLGGRLRFHVDDIHALVVPAARVAS
jgi:hypothetical protein